MPELPEVETVRTRLAPDVEGRTIVRARVDDIRLVRPELPESVAAALTGATIERVDRRGKYLLLRLASGETLAVHLRMTGNLLRRTAGDEAPRFVRAELELDDGSLVAYTDIRRFGTWELLRDVTVADEFIDAAARARAVLGRVHAGLPVRGAAPPERAREGGAARSARRRRARQHLRRRVAVGSEDPSRAAGIPAAAPGRRAPARLRSAPRSPPASRRRAPRSATTACRTAATARRRSASPPTGAPASPARAAARRSAASSSGSAERTSARTASGAPRAPEPRPGDRLGSERWAGRLRSRE